MLRVLFDCRYRRMIFCLLAVLGSGAPAFGWNGHGHRTVASAAWRQLTPETRIRVMELLKLNPYFPRWAAKVPQSASASERDELIFIQAATWADDIKDRSSGYISDPRQPDSTTPSDYSDMRRHMYWHFRDVPFSNDGTPLPALQTPNAETEIARHRQTLASATATNAQKSYAMVWLVHLVGDIHQPLHAATRVSHDMPNGDLGGNKVAIKGAHANSLHAFWDDILGTHSDIAAAPKTAAALPTAGAAAQVMDEKAWVQESFRLAVEKVYVDPIGEGPGPFQINEQYKNAASEVAKKQAALAGQRLANILNTELLPANTNVVAAPADRSIAVYAAAGAVLAAGLLTGWWLMRVHRK
jgi:hypothetical protein